MTKGIREYTNARFQHHLPQLTELGNTAFRKAVMSDTIAQFSISIASAATHYNHALKEARKNSPDVVKNLGRADDKKGGRKPTHTVDVIKVKTGEVVATGLSKAAATEMIEKAAAARKGKLAIKEPEAPAEAAADALDAAVAADAIKFPKAADFEQPGEQAAAEGDKRPTMAAE